jgi:hypothetical protein
MGAKAGVSGMGTGAGPSAEETGVGPANCGGWGGQGALRWRRVGSSVLWMPAWAPIRRQILVLK